MTIQVLIVDDSPTVRRALRQLIETEADLEVLAEAGDPFQAVEVIKRRLPDVIILDIEMPRMDGLSFLRRIMAQRPIPVIICSTLVEQGNAAFLEAFRAGAVEVISKPKMGVAEKLEESRIAITDKIRAAAHVQHNRFNRRPAPPGRSTQTADAGARRQRNESPRNSDRPRRSPPGRAVGGGQKLSPDLVLPPRDLPIVGTRAPIVAIGASTGGTQALETVLSALDPGVCGIVIVQHMPERFTAAFAHRLNQICPLTVKEAQSGDYVRPGVALIAPGNHHLIVRHTSDAYKCEVMEGPLVSRHRPSVDVLFRSVAQEAGAAALGVIMTGMGDDGAIGMTEMKQAGAYTIGQNQASCVVYGMPAEAARRGCVDKETDLAGIAAAIRSFGAVSPRRARAH